MNINSIVDEANGGEEDKEDESIGANVGDERSDRQSRLRRTSLSCLFCGLPILSDRFFSSLSPCLYFLQLKIQSFIHVRVNYR